MFATAKFELWGSTVVGQYFMLAVDVIWKTSSNPL